MKNWKGWALVVLAAVALASPAFAVSKSGPYLRTDQLTWRVHKAAFLAGYQQDAVGGYLDSVAFNRIGVGGATMGVANAETTTAISTMGWTTPPSAATTIDSLEFARVNITDSGSTASAVDSLYLAMQVSTDGKNWIYVNQVKDASGANPITASSPAVNSFPLLNLAGATTSTPKLFSFGFSTGIRGAQYADKFNWFHFPLARFILVNKTVGSYIHNFNISVTHWAADAAE